MLEPASAYPRSRSRDRCVLDLVGIAIIGEAARNSPHQTQTAIHLAQQDGATIGGEPTRVETTYDLTPTEGVKCEWRGVYTVYSWDLLVGLIWGFESTNIIR